MNARIASAHGANWRRRFVAIARQLEQATDLARPAKAIGLRVRLQSSGMRHARTWK